jgi:hypothetical protein
MNWECASEWPFGSCKIRDTTYIPGLHLECLVLGRMCLPLAKVLEQDQSYYHYADIRISSACVLIMESGFCYEPLTDSNKSL